MSKRNLVKNIVWAAFSTIHVFCWIVAYFSLFIAIFIHYAWGNVDLTQLLFFAQTDLEGTDAILCIQAMVVCVLLPIVMTVFTIIIWRYAIKVKNKKAYALLIYFDLILFSTSFYAVIQKFMPYVDFSKTNFYEQRYVNINYPEQKYRRNVILLFGESFETKHASLPEENLRVQDDDAIKFDDLTEGYAQRWTHGALFSSFTGVHIHYLSEYILHAFSDKLRLWSYDPEQNILLSNKVGRNFDFDLPNMRFLSDILHYNGYQTLFVKGGSIYFAGTKRFLENHGFDPENVYGYESFEEWKDFVKTKKWWGVDDKTMLQMFKEKITSLDKNKPFFAVGFTLDFHAGANPLFQKKADMLKSNIININDFISWFKKQDFYENTTLIILGDHKRMGRGVYPGGGIYNAFFNLPKELLENLNTHRTFNQIDMFPTLLEIMGFELPDHQAGMGTSIFSSKRTLAEEYSYSEQMKIFTKVDDFYKKLWSKEIFLH